MKKLLICMMILGATSSFASTLDSAIVESMEDPNNNEVVTNVKKALKMEINKSILNCNWSAGDVIDGSIQEQLITLLDDERTEISSTGCHSQPVITSFTQLASNKEVVIKYTTTPDLKKLVKIDIKKEEMSRVVDNVRTILDPRFETVTKRTTTIAGWCSVKY